MEIILIWMSLNKVTYSYTNIKKKVWSITILQLWKYAIVRSRGTFVENT
jgi:hypothetical protein